jgi:hypothetical protein
LVLGEAEADDSAVASGMLLEGAARLDASMASAGAVVGAEAAGGVMCGCNMAQLVVHKLLHAALPALTRHGGHRLAEYVRAAP